MDRQTAIAKATDAADQAALLAKEATRYASSFDSHSKTARFAAAGAAWADTSRAYTALAEAFPVATSADGDH